MGFLSGDTEPVLARLEAEMLSASEDLQFERAARLRDRIIAVHKAAESQQMVSDRAEDFDVVGLAEDPLEASVQIFLVRRGRVVGHRGFVAEKVEDLSGPEFMAQVVAQVYGAEGADVPRRLLVPEEPADRGCCRVGCTPSAAARSTSRSRSAAPSAPCRKRSPARPARTWPGTACAGLPTTMLARRR